MRDQAHVAPVVRITGLPSGSPATESAMLRSRIHTAVSEFMESGAVETLAIMVSAGDAGRGGAPASGEQTQGGNEEVHKRAARYRAQAPLWTMAALVLPQETGKALRVALRSQQMQGRLFDQWGLRAIEPFPRTALNFHGAPGTGKTMAAHAVADDLGKPILAASYADIESMYHGEAPKNVEALFAAAEAQNAMLFIDEADSLLSRRLVNVTQGAEQSANSLRSQLLICLERFRGTVIFATNLVENYDPAFESRVQHICFRLPDAEMRRAIWRNHLPARLPLADDVDVQELVERSEGYSGREIKQTVLAAAARALEEDAGETSCVRQHHFLEAMTEGTESRPMKPAGGRTLSERIRGAWKADAAGEDPKVGQ